MTIDRAAPIRAVVVTLEPPNARRGARRARRLPAPSPEPSGDRDGGAEGWSPRWALRAWAVTWLVVSTVVVLSYRWGSRGDAASRVAAGPAGLDRWLGGWMWFDAVWYGSIVDHGYYYLVGQQSPVAFWPSYPMAVRLPARALGSTGLGLLAVSTACGLAAVVLLDRWAHLRLPVAHRRSTVAALVLFPYAWFLYGTGYSDGFFLAAALGAFVLLEQRRPVLAGLCGTVAAVARPVGVAVVLALAVAALVDLVRDGRRGTLAAPALAAGGIGAWSSYLWVRFGDPLAFATVEAAPGWGQGQGPRTWLKVDFFAQVSRSGRDALRLLPHAGLTVVAMGLVPVVWRRLGATYGAYSGAVVAIAAVGTGSFMGCARYLLVAFPLFAVAGPALARRRGIGRAAALVGGVGLVVGASLFGRGWYLS